jgi:hypothetical protein
MIWNTNAKAKIEVIKLDNGYVIEWERQKTAAEKRSRFTISDADAEDSWPTVRGIEIVATETALLKRLKELV